MSYVDFVYFASTPLLSTKGSDKAQIVQGGGASDGSQTGKWRVSDLFKWQTNQKSTVLESRLGIFHWLISWWTFFHPSVRARRCFQERHRLRQHSEQRVHRPAVHVGGKCVGFGWERVQSGDHLGGQCSSGHLQGACRWERKTTPVSPDHTDKRGFLKYMLMLCRCPEVWV